jgi:hypothetical protein
MYLKQDHILYLDTKKCIHKYSFEEMKSLILFSDGNIVNNRLQSSFWDQIKSKNKKISTY